MNTYVLQYLLPGLSFLSVGGFVDFITIQNGAVSWRSLQCEQQEIPIGIGSIHIHRDNLIHRILKKEAYQHIMEKFDTCHQFFLVTSFGMDANIKTVNQFLFACNKFSGSSQELLCRKYFLL